MRNFAFIAVILFGLTVAIPFIEERPTCVVKGDPHHTTFDNVSYNFSGHCAYTMVEDAVHNPPLFSVTAENMFQSGGRYSLQLCVTYSEFHKPMIYVYRGKSINSPLEQ
ncbi:alpha-tectorin-like [Saccoglossus kowalevskii]